MDHTGDKIPRGTKNEDRQLLRMKVRGRMKLSQTGKGEGGREEAEGDR